MGANVMLIVPASFILMRSAKKYRVYHSSTFDGGGISNQITTNPIKTRSELKRSKRGLP